MNILEIITLVEGFTEGDGESNDKDVSVDSDYYMIEGCGIFAIALSRLMPGGEIYLLSKVGIDAEEWNDDFPYEVTHVFYEVNGKTYDVRGARSPADMAKEFHVFQFVIRGPWSPEDFAARFIGESDDLPLYGDKASISEAIRFIKNNPKC